jgi:NAD(P)-dependent dehydrogenase (short-subunit alcohol dehydrogenase family)
MTDQTNNQTETQMPKPNVKDAPIQKAYIITGPTSGLGRFLALELAKHGAVVLVGRDREKLAEMQALIERGGQKAASIVCDLSDIASVKRAAAEIIALNLPIAGLLNNAGMRQSTPTQNALGWDMSFVTNHVGPFVLTEALMPHLADGTNILFVTSAVEDPGRKLAVRFGFRGARYISAEASARGEWKPGGSVRPGFDSYATTKQGALVTAREFARENPRLRINAIEPGLMPMTSLGRDAPPHVHFFATRILPLLSPFIKHLTTPQRAARVLTKVLLNESGKTGVYYDESGRPMPGSEQSRDPTFTARVVAETRALVEKAGA